MDTPLEDAAGGAGTRSLDAPIDPVPGAPERPSEEGESGSDGGLVEAVSHLDARLEESQRLHARQSDLVDRLHAENQELRAGELRNAQLPLIRDLHRLHDDIARMREAVGEDDGDLRIVQEGLVDVLARSGVESFSPGPGEPFDPRLHAVAGTEPTAEEALDKSVAEVLKSGFRWESGEVIRVAEVRAYRYLEERPDETPELDH